MDFDGKLKSIAKFAQSLSYRQRIVCTPWIIKKERVRTETQMKFGTHKPYGIWYSLGDSWIHWILKNAYTEIGSEYRDFAVLSLKQYSFFYELDINPSTLKIIRTQKDLDKFTKKYKDTLIPDNSYIDWSKVAEDFNGIEFHIKKETKKSTWYYGYDCYGGVFWDSKPIESVKLLKGFENLYKEVSCKNSAK